MDAGEAMSNWIHDEPGICAAASSNLARSRDARITRAPPAASAFAHAKPMPRLAPVTRAVLFVIFKIMAYADLRDFIRALEKHGELKRIPFEVDPHLEITEFADRSVKNGGPALLFEKPKGSNVPLLINAFASEKRMQIALEVDSVDAIATRIAYFLQMKMTDGMMGKLKMLPMLAEMGAIFPKIVESGPCKEVIRSNDFSLDDFPILHCWPDDGGRYITLPMVFSRNPDTGKRNCGCY